MTQILSRPLLRELERQAARMARLAAKYDVKRNRCTWPRLAFELALLAQTFREAERVLAVQLPHRG